MTDVLKTEMHWVCRMDLTRQIGFVVTVYDPEGQRLGVTERMKTPDDAFAAGRKIIENKVPLPAQMESLARTIGNASDKDPPE